MLRGDPPRKHLLIPQEEFDRIVLVSYSLETFFTQVKIFLSTLKRFFLHAFYTPFSNLPHYSIVERRLLAPSLTSATESREMLTVVPLEVVLAEAPAPVKIFSCLDDHIWGSVTHVHRAGSRFLQPVPQLRGAVSVGSY